MTQMAWEVPMAANPHPAVACEAVGSKDDWKKWRQQYPRCNRPEGHELPHRVYNRRAEVLAEWTQSPGGSKTAKTGSASATGGTSTGSPRSASPPPSPGAPTSASSSPTDDGAAS